uniref:Uncharacterized protein n=1 Tax=Rhizophora mucronata TaxID=61149 RepID=A0A2P2NQR8_RHIMU
MKCNANGMYRNSHIWCTPHKLIISYMGTYLQQG